MLPKELCKLVPKSHLMSEAEWRSLGVQQSQGWIHYMKHEPGLFLLQVLSNVCNHGNRVYPNDIEEGF